MQVEPKQRGALVCNVVHLPPLRMPPLLVSRFLAHLLHPTRPVYLRSLQTFELESTRGRCGHTLAAALSCTAPVPAAVYACFSFRRFLGFLLM